jgi:hypothetical protein
MTTRGKTKNVYTILVRKFLFKTLKANTNRITSRCVSDRCDRGEDSAGPG